MRPVLLLIALLVLCTAPAAEAAKRKVPQGFVGTVWDAAALGTPNSELSREWKLMASSGVESVRVPFSWATAQPTRGAPFDFRATDRVVAQASWRGMGILPVVIEAPRWARRNPREYGSRPVRTADYTAYLRALVRRYGSRGSFWSAGYPIPRRPIRYWQIWNEPHSSNFWYVPKSQWPRTYVSLLKAAHRTVKRTDRRGKVVLAGLTNAAWNHIRSIYRRGGRRYFDVAASQVYTGSVRNVFIGARLIRRTMTRRGDRRKPLWITEASWPAARGRVPGVERRFPFATTDRGMARRVSQFFRGAVRARRNKRIRLGRAYWYTWASTYRENYAFNYSGLLVTSGGQFRAKPAFYAFRKSARRYEGCRKTARGRCR